MLLRDLDFEVAFKYIDEATVADWKGKDLKQAKHIPNIDILLLAVRKVIIVFFKHSENLIQMVHVSFMFHYHAVHKFSRADK